MNFLAGIIFVAVEDEVLAFSVLQRIMQSKSQAQTIQSDIQESMRAPADCLAK